MIICERCEWCGRSSGFTDSILTYTTVGVFRHLCSQCRMFYNKHDELPAKTSLHYKDIQSFHDRCMMDNLNRKLRYAMQAQKPLAT